MKLKKVIILMTFASMLVSGAIDATSIEYAEAMDVPTSQVDNNSEQSNLKADMYRFLQETRAEANADGEVFLKTESLKVLENQTSNSSKELEKAIDSYLSSLSETAVNNKRKEAVNAREKLLDRLRAGDEQVGVKFTDPQRAKELNNELASALSALSNAVTESAEVIDKQAAENSSKNNNSVTNKRPTFEGDEEFEEPVNGQEWSDADLKEVALCQAPSPNVADGVGNCNSTVRSYMAYTAVTSKTSAQYALLNSQKAYTDKKTGFRMYEGRYCIAVGSGYTQKIGTKIDLVLSNGAILKCVLGDCKSDKDTDEATHTYCKWDGSVAEFIIDNDYFKTGTERNPVNTALDQFDSIEKVVVING